METEVKISERGAAGAEGAPRLAKIFLVLLLSAHLAWPVIHAGMVYVYDMNPWKFFGWAMYAVPPPGVEIELYDLTGGGRRPLPPAATSAEDLEALQAYLRLRVDTGSLVSPLSVARITFAAYPQVDDLEIAIVHTLFDLGERRVLQRSYPYRYDRDEVSPR